MAEDFDNESEAIRDRQKPRLMIKLNGVHILQYSEPPLRSVGKGEWDNNDEEIAQIGWKEAHIWFYI